MTRNRSLSIAAGILFLLYGALKLIDLFTFQLPRIESFNPYIYLLLWFPPIVFCVIGLLLVINKFYIGIVITLGIYFAMFLLRYIRYIQISFSKIPPREYIPLLGCLLFWVASLIALRQGSLSSKILSIASGICYLLYYIIANIISLWSNYFSPFGNIVRFFSRTFSYSTSIIRLLCDGIFLPVAIILFGLWTYSTEKSKKSATGKLSSQSVVNSADAADRIIALKKLLDAGIITQDEFDRKKSEIL